MPAVVVFVCVSCQQQTFLHVNAVAVDRLSPDWLYQPASDSCRIELLARLQPFETRAKEAGHDVGTDLCQGP